MVIIYATDEGSELTHFALVQAKRARDATEVRPSQTRPCRRAFPTVWGRLGLACQPFALVFILAAGRRKRTWALRARAPIHTARVRESAPVRPVCRLRCPSASPPGLVSQGASCIVRLGDGWTLRCRRAKGEPLAQGCLSNTATTGNVGTGMFNTSWSQSGTRGCLLRYTPNGSSSPLSIQACVRVTSRSVPFALSPMHRRVHARS
jgi:hypothetical protein